MIRVIAGKFKSRQLRTLPGDAIRPTSDRLKETLFDVLQTEIEGRKFLDCYAGTGSIGIEALSRGASYVAFIESSARAARVLRENLRQLGLFPSAQCLLLNKPVEEGLKIMEKAELKFDIVFLDPPYAAAEEYPMVLRKLCAYGILEDQAIVMAEHSKKIAVAAETAGLTRVREVKQGDSILTFYRELDYAKTRRDLSGIL
jgi:16S rRNA (guanine966-N2)-methyltransferase